MDEYIKKSDLKSELLRRGFYPAIVKSALETIPPADVVPGAMIAEIFEEIEKVIGEQYENYVFDNLDIEGAEQDAIIAFVDVMKRHFAELKKKHTEGENKQKDFFSPEAVRAMSRKEVKENYNAIMDSMKKW